MGEIYGQKININDPLFSVKSAVMQHTSYLHDKIREDRDRRNAIIYFVTSLILTMLFSFFSGYLKEVAILTLMNLLTLLLIKSTKDYNKQRERFWSNRKKMKESFKTLDMEWRD